MSFPVNILKDCQNALCLFAAGRGGKNDVQYIMDSGLRFVTMVDNDPVMMKELASKYKRGLYIIENGFDYINHCIESGQQFDIVTVDPWTGVMERRTWRNYPKLKKITRKYLVMGFSDRKTLPPGEVIKRSEHNGGTYWHITKIKKP